LLAATLDIGTACNPVVGRDGCSQLLEGKPELTQSVRIGDDVKLPDITAETVHTSDTRHGAKNGAQDPVLQRPKLHKITTGALQGVLVDLAEARRYRPETAFRTFGELALDREDPFQNQLARKVDIGPVFEDNGHHGQPELGERAHLGRVRETGARLFDGIGHELFDLTGRESGRL
jgi:hypothetical protein